MLAHDDKPAPAKRRQCQRRHRLDGWGELYAFCVAPGGDGLAATAAPALDGPGTHAVFSVGLAVHRAAAGHRPGDAAGRRHEASPRGLAPDAGHRATDVCGVRASLFRPFPAPARRRGGRGLAKGRAK